MDSTPSKDSMLVDPSSVAVLGPVEPTTSSSPAVPEKKSKKDKVSSSSSKAKKPTKSAEDSKFDELDKKWTDRFNKLEALLLAKSLQPVDQPTFSAAVKVPPSRSPPATVNKDSEPFFQPVSSGRTGTDSSVSLHQSASQPGSETTTTSSKRTGKDTSASQHLSPSQLVTDQKSARPSSPGRTGKDSASEHRPASQPSSDRHRPVSHTGTDPSFRHSTDSKARSDRPRSTLATDSGSPSLHRQCRDSSSSGSSASASDYSDRPPVDLYAEEGELSETPGLHD